jgi:hypothetical protein
MFTDMLLGGMACPAHDGIGHLKPCFIEEEAMSEAIWLMA